jgi:hypothetical protein
MRGMAKGPCDVAKGNLHERLLFLSFLVKLSNLSEMMGVTKDSWVKAGSFIRLATIDHRVFNELTFF